MNKSKKRRLIKEGAKHGDATLYHCPFPNCRSIFAKAPGLPDCCDKHRQFIADIYFFQEHVHRAKPSTPPPGSVLAKKEGVILIPKPGMAAQAIKEAAANAAKGGPNEPKRS